MELLKTETQIMYDIEDGHPFLLNLITVMETQVRTTPELLRNLRAPFQAIFVKLSTEAHVISYWCWEQHNFRWIESLEVLYGERLAKGKQLSVL